MILPDEISQMLVGLPGESLVRKGLADLINGKESLESLLVLIGRPRLRLLGIDIPKQPNPDADRRLYERLCETHGMEAHSQYNSLLRQLVSFERALEHRHSARERLKAGV
jgi:hypothetical protein